MPAANASGIATVPTRGASRNATPTVAPNPVTEVRPGPVSPGPPGVSSGAARPRPRQNSRTPALTARQLNRATLDRQLLLRRELVSVVDAVRRVVALQAQEPASPYLALWNRIRDFDPADLDRAFAARAVVKATLMRVTLHAVDAADYPAFHEAMQPTLRAARLNDRRFKRTGLTSADADSLLPEVLGFADRPRTNAEAEAWLDERLGETPRPGIWWAYRQYGPFVHAPTGGPWAFGPRPSYVAATDHRWPGEQAEAIRRLALRYLEGFGPATAQDFGQFGMIYRSPAREAFRSLVADGSVVTLEGPNGAELFDVRDGLLPPDSAAAPARLLPMWDSTLLAYADRGRIIPPDVRRLVIRSNGDVLPTLLVDGYVAGVWRPAPGGIEMTAFDTLEADAWDGLATEARRLLGFLDSREPTVYRRYGRWWNDLPAAEIRVLGT
jgi:winged helix DNA-binding protein